jgi:dihydroorotate dehydrogenase (fumarate)
MSADFKTSYLGLALENPLVVAACPLSRELHQIEQLEQAGAGAAVMYSLFAEQATGDSLRGVGSAADVAGVYSESGPRPGDYASSVDSYLRNIELAKKSVSMPIIGSLNGAGPGDWTRFAPLMEQAGADALELNVYFVPTDPQQTGSQVEAQYLEIVRDVRSQIEIPLSVKLGPFFSSLPNFSQQLADAGADGLVLFNRFLQPDIDVETREAAPRLTLSSRDELRLPLRWIAILRSQLSLSLAATTGVHCAEDVLKLLLAGADVVMIASALLQHGPSFITHLREELEAFLEAKQIPSIGDLRGAASQQRVANPEAFERANYIKSLISFEM